MNTSTQLLARGHGFSLFRTPLGHVAIVGQIRDGLDITISIAHVDFTPVRSPCLLVDCAQSDYEARVAATTILDWVLSRASIEPRAEVWLVPDAQRELSRNPAIRERAVHRTVELASTEAQALAAIMGVCREAADSDASIRWSTLLHVARSESRKRPSQRAPSSMVADVDELLLRAALGTIRESIMVTDASLAPPGPRILYVNRAFTEITGYTAEEVIGESPWILHGRRTDKAVLEKLRTAFEHGTELEVETFNYRKDGAEISVQWSVHPLRDDTGKVVRYFAIQRDVTEARRYEAIAHAVNMTDNIGMIFSGIRHELGNPINSIKTAMSVLRRQHRAFGPDKTDTYLDGIMAEIARVEFLLSSLRSFTAFERAKTEDVSISEFLRDFSRLVKSDVESHAIRFEIVEDDSRPHVRVDPRALNQVLLNLVHNACDALADRADGGVRVEVGTVGQNVRLAVRDNGCGMSQNQIDHLFVPFHTTKERGTGLGLVIAQKLVTEMGGHLHVKSERGRGTDVMIDLARAAGARG